MAARSKESWLMVAVSVAAVVLFVVAIAIIVAKKPAAVEDPDAIVWDATHTCQARAACAPVVEYGVCKCSR
jgi:hypothetical protein